MKKVFPLIIVIVLAVLGLGFACINLLNIDSTYFYSAKYYNYETIMETENIPFKVSKVSDDSLEYGKTRTINNGANGIKTIEYRIKYQGNIEVSREKITEEITTQPTDKVIAVGTKIIWRCYDVTSFDKNPYNDNKCINSTGEIVYVPDSQAMALDAYYSPGKSGHPYYNGF